jgi:protease I
MRLTGKKIGILIEGDFFENEIFYYEFRFPEEGAEVHYLSRLWGNESITFLGHELKAPFVCRESFETINDAELATYDAIIVPSGMVSDRLRYTEDLRKLPPATAFLARAFANPNILKGIICHGLWLTAPDTSMIRGRRLVCHNNLHGDALAYGAQFVDQDVVVDRDLVTARTGKHCHMFAKKIIELLEARKETKKSRNGAPELVAAGA